MDEKMLKRVKPWALVLKDMMEAVEQDGKQPGSVGMTFGQMIAAFCVWRGVPYPPDDVRHVLLTVAARRAFSGAPCPKGFA